MYMMMIQRSMDNQWREQQFKSESEQREQECQLCWEEMAIACKEAHEQRQLMSLMFMSMLNKTGGATATHHLAPAPITTIRIYSTIDICLLIFKIEYDLTMIKIISSSC
jgi:hypothetical protein